MAESIYKHRAGIAQWLLLGGYLLVNILLLFQDELAAGIPFLVNTVINYGYTVIAGIFGFCYLGLLLLITIFNYRKKEENIQAVVSLLLILVIANLIVITLTTILSRDIVILPAAASDMEKQYFIFRQNPFVLTFIIAMLFMLAYFFIITKNSKSQQQLSRNMERIQELQALKKHVTDYLFTGKDDLDKKLNLNTKDMETFLIATEQVKHTVTNWADAYFELRFLDYEVAGALKFLDIIGGDFYDIWLERQFQKPTGTNYSSGRLLLSLFDVCGHSLIESWYLNHLIRFLQQRKEHFNGKELRVIYKRFCTFLLELQTIYYKQPKEHINIPCTLCQLDESGEVKIIYSQDNLKPLRYSLENGHLSSIKSITSITPGEKETTIMVNSLKLEPYDFLILATDGLKDNLFPDVSDQEMIRQMEKYFQSKVSTETTAATLTRTILNHLKDNAEAGLSKDDVSYMIIKKRGGTK